MVRMSAIAASLAAVGASAFVPTTMPPAYLQSRAVSAPPLRMQFGDMFKKAFENNPNIPSAPAVGPGSPGFSKTMPQKPQKNSAEDSSVAVAPPPVAPPPAAVWQQATDPASGNPTPAKTTSATAVAAALPGDGEDKEEWAELDRRLTSVSAGTTAGAALKGPPDMAAQQQTLAVEVNQVIDLCVG